MKKRIVTLCVILCIIICFAAGCGPGTGIAQPGSAGSSQGSAGSPPPQQATASPQQTTPPPQQATPSQTPPPPPPDEPRPETLEEQLARTIKATLTMEDGGVIEIELYPDLAPQSVRNFVYLARQGYYDGLKFHRIIKNFMIQGGCPDGTGTGNPGYKIKGEFSDNGF